MQPTEGIEIELSPNVLHEGESEGNAPQLDMHGSHEYDAEAKRKWHIDDQHINQTMKLGTYENDLDLMIDIYKNHFQKKRNPKNGYSHLWK